MSEVFQVPHHGAKLSVIVRGFLGKAIIFQTRATITEEQIAPFIQEMAEEHAQACADGRIGMIEVEFPEFPPNERFCRMGPDTTRMVNPIRVDL